MSVKDVDDRGRATPARAEGAEPDRTPLRPDVPQN